MINAPTKPTVLIVEDEAGPRNALTVILRPFFNLYAAENGHAALQVLKERQVDLVTLDLKLPDHQGLDLLQEIKLERNDVEVIIITGYGSLKSALDGIRYGASGYLLKPFNVAELIGTINRTLKKKQRLDFLRGFLRGTADLWATDHDTVLTWARVRKQHDALLPQEKQGSGPKRGDAPDHAMLLSDLLEAKDRELYNHSTRSSFYASLLAKPLNLTPMEQQSLTVGAFLHDIGKIDLDGCMLSKSDRLEDDYELEAFKRHPEIGARIILPFRFPAEVGQIVAYHHEAYDGSGYPNGLQGEGIPLLARIVSLAESFDHLVTGRAAQPALGVEEACEQIRRQSGVRFDPALAGLFAQTVNESKATLPALAITARAPVIPEF
jgi:putative nucleotidyltransferase with HDIG domain